MARISDDLISRVDALVAERVDPQVAEVFATCFRNTLDTTITDLDDGTSFMLTGDIPAMWLRDSTAQLSPYLHFAGEDPLLAETISRIAKRQLRYILDDPYANAFNASANGAGHQSDVTEQSPIVWERKYEVDSLCYPMQLSHDLWVTTGRTDHLDEIFRRAAAAIIALWRTEQDHERLSPYRFERFDGADTDTLEREGRGRLVSPTGLTWSGFRPSDDASLLGYNIPANAFAAVELGHIAEIAREVLGDEELASQADALRAEIEKAILEYGRIADPRHGALLAYEVNGSGNHVLMDDANVPSLLSLPLIGWCAADDPLYLATRAVILSDANPYFYEGSAAKGIGSPHTPAEHVWPIALAVQGLTSLDPEEQRGLLATLSTTEAGTGLMHESFHVDDPAVYTREWFSWANAMYCELVLEVAGLRSHRRSPAIGEAAA